MAELVRDEPAAAMPHQSVAGLPPRQWPSAPELAVVIPVLNESDNVAPIVERLSRVLADIRWEAIFVDDDSPDGTADVVRALARLQGNIRCVQRLGRRGLASACIEGILSSAAPYIAIMDGDLQHDESLLPQMLAQIKSMSWSPAATRKPAASAIGSIRGSSSAMLPAGSPGLSLKLI